MSQNSLVCFSFCWCRSCPLLIDFDPHGAIALLKLQVWFSVCVFLAHSAWRGFGLYPQVSTIVLRSISRQSNDLWSRYARVATSRNTVQQNTLKISRVLKSQCTVLLSQQHLLLFPPTKLLVFCVAWKIATVPLVVCNYESMQFAFVYEVCSSIQTQIRTHSLTNPPTWCYWSGLVWSDSTIYNIVLLYNTNGQLAAAAAAAGTDR